MSNTKIIIIAVIALGVGLCSGMAFEFGDDRTGYHMMNDGGIMMNNDSGMSHMMGSMTSDLIGKTGDNFDKTFLSGMIVHHEGAVAMAELALKNAKHQEIKDLANAIIAAQNKEIADMKAWQKKWYQVNQ
jgi:uncharacterized protein (DUF305 family)